MIIFLAGGFSSSSTTLKTRLENHFNVKSMTLKAGSGIGHMNINIRLKKLIKLKILNFFNKNILIDQHFFPIKHNLHILDNLFGLDNIKFIVTYRNIFDTINNLLKRKEDTNTFHFLRSGFYNTYENFEDNKYNINIFDVLVLINFYALWFKMEKENYIKNIEFIDFEDNTKNIDVVNQQLSDYLKIDLNLKKDIKANLFEKKKYEINNDLKQFVINYSKCFKDIDFSRIGL